MRLQSNLPDVLERIKSKVESLIDDDTTMREAAFNAQALISNRIQQQGRLTNGSPIGEYSAVSRRLRSLRGRQTSFIDLTFTGSMLDRSFNVIPYPGGAALAITNARDLAKWKKNEQRFGIFGQLSPDERTLVLQGIQQSLNEKFSR